MAWTTPRTWVEAEVPTATTWNTHLRDNLDYLYSAGITYAGARAGRGTAQSITNASWTKVQLATEAWDTGSEFDSATNYRYTAASAKKVLVVGSLGLVSANGSVWVSIYKNGAISHIVSAWPLAAALDPDIQCFGEIDLATNDYLELYAYHATGASVNTRADVNRTWMSVSKVGA